MENLVARHWESCHLGHLMTKAWTCLLRSACFLTAAPLSEPSFELGSWGARTQGGDIAAGSRHAQKHGADRGEQCRSLQVLRLVQKSSAVA